MILMGPFQPEIFYDFVSSVKAMPIHLVEGQGLETSALSLQILWYLLAKGIKINHLWVVVLSQEG